MEYGLRRYEATQRLLWFLFFLGCLGLAYVAAPIASQAPPEASTAFRSFQPDMLKSLDFWFDLRWLRVEPLGRMMVYLVWVAFIFLGGRLLGLIVQYGGKYYVRSLLAAGIGSSEEKPKPSSLPPHCHEV